MSLAGCRQPYEAGAVPEKPVAPVEDWTPRSLWARLLAGGVTEVCVLSERLLHRVLPQSLGLEVIDYGAYLYDSRGVPRTPEQRERLARELAAEPRWVATGGPRYWIEQFARRAEVIVVIAIDPVDSARRHVPGLRQAVPEPYDWSEWQKRHDHRVVGRLGRHTGEFTCDGPMSSAGLVAHVARMRNLLVGEFPDKTFVLRYRGQVRQLRSVRALPGG